MRCCLSPKLKTISCKYTDTLQVGRLRGAKVGQIMRDNPSGDGVHGEGRRTETTPGAVEQQPFAPPAPPAVPYGFSQDGQRSDYDTVGRKGFLSSSNHNLGSEKSVGAARDDLVMPALYRDLCRRGIRHLRVPLRRSDTISEYIKLLKQKTVVQPLFKQEAENATKATMLARRHCCQVKTSPRTWRACSPERKSNALNTAWQPRQRPLLVMVYNREEPNFR